MPSSLPHAARGCDAEVAAALLRPALGSRGVARPAPVGVGAAHAQLTETIRTIQTASRGTHGSRRRGGSRVL